MVNAHPEGTTFCFQPGTYRLAGPVIAKSRDRFIGQPGDDPRRTGHSGEGDLGVWRADRPARRRRARLTFANFTGKAVQTGWYWTVSQNDIHDNQIGVEVNSYSHWTGTTSITTGNTELPVGRAPTC